MQQWWQMLTEASARAGLPIAYREDTEQLLEDAGFRNITRRKIRIPFHNNENDNHEWNITGWYRTAMGHVESPKNKNAFAGLSMSHFTRQLGMSEAEVRDMCRDVTWAVNKRFTPLYNNL